MTTPTDPNRASFEDACWAYYQELKAKGWKALEEGDTSQRESLFWRKPSGIYGVQQIEACWNGWNLKMKADNGMVLNVLQRFEPLVQAALGLLKEISRRVDEEQPPMKYVVPYGHVNVLNQALGLAEMPVPEVFLRSLEVQQIKAETHTRRRYEPENIGVRLVMIDDDRYSGSYSEALFTAWPGVRPSDIDAGDPDCHNFWHTMREGGFWETIWGQGDTPQAAFRDLRQKWQQAGWEFDGECRVVDIGSKVFLFDSTEFNDWLGR